MNIESINEKLSEYLEFDVSILYESPNYKDFVNIYGGCLRDIISGRAHNIADIDIMSSGTCIFNHIAPILVANGYVLDKYTSRELVDAYSHVRKAIFEPINYRKGHKVVQLIRPCNCEGDTYLHRLKSVIDLISNVDISCCGLYYNDGKLYECYEDAYVHALSSVFNINRVGTFYSNDRISNRIKKMKEKGFSQIVDDNKTYVENLKFLIRNDNEYIAQKCLYAYTMHKENDTYENIDDYMLW